MKGNLPQKFVNESKRQINKKYTHFAVRKTDNKIANGWELLRYFLFSFEVQGNSIAIYNYKGRLLITI